MIKRDDYLRRLKLIKPQNARNLSIYRNMLYSPYVTLYCNVMPYSHYIAMYLSINQERQSWGGRGGLVPLRFSFGGTTI